MSEIKNLFNWEDIKLQFDKDMQKVVEHAISMAKETKISQQVDLKYGSTIIASFGIFPSGKLYKLK